MGGVSQLPTTRTSTAFSQTGRFNEVHCSKLRPIHRLLLSVLTVSAVLGCIPKIASAASLKDIESIYVFGDSLSDVGNALEATGGIVPSSPPYFEGRFSNGPVWVENLASKLDVTFNPDPNLDTNFAVGGSTTGRSNNNPLPGLPGLEQQIDNFIEDLPEDNPSADSNALYILWAGANDYLGGETTDPTEPVENLSSAITSLASVGAQTILVANLPNLGELPLTREGDDSDALNALSEAHNLGLAESLVSLNQTLDPDVDIFSLNVNSLFDQAIADPAKFGFTNVTEACLNLTSSCDNPDKYLFWDGFHPTARSHQLVAESALTTLKSKPVPEPASTLGILTFGALGAGSLLKRKQKQQKKQKAASPMKNIV